MFYVREYYINKNGIVKHRELIRNIDKELAYKSFSEILSKKSRDNYKFYEFISAREKAVILKGLNYNGKRVIILEKE